MIYKIELKDFEIERTIKDNGYCDFLSINACCEIEYSCDDEVARFVSCEPSINLTKHEIALIEEEALLIHQEMQESNKNALKGIE